MIQILAQAPELQGSGVMMLTDAELTDLKAGKFYVSAVDARNPLLGARGNLVLP
jgi:hypothetical protein